MPGFELIGNEERNAVNEIFDSNSLFYNGKRVKYFERQFEKSIREAKKKANTGGLAQAVVKLTDY